MAAADVCDAEKLRFNGGYHCRDSGDTYSCTLYCPSGVEFEFPASSVYVCTYDKGIFEPQPVPQCKVENNVKIISHGTFYNTYLRESNHSWSMENVYDTKTQHTQKVHGESYRIHGSNVSSHPVNNTLHSRKFIIYIEFVINNVICEKRLCSSN